MWVAENSREQQRTQYNSKSNSTIGSLNIMESSSSASSKRRRLMQSYILSQRSDLPAIFESLNDDSKRLVLKFVGNKSYVTYAGINKHCKEIYLNTKGMKKETFVYGYGPLSVIKDRIERATALYDWEFYERVGKGVVLYNRSDVLDWLLEERNKDLLRGICVVASSEGRIDVLEEVWNNVEDDDDKKYIFKYSHEYAARRGKLNVMKWLETKGLPINKYGCATLAAEHGQLHILQWLREEQYLELDGPLYSCAAIGGHLHVMKWLREQEVDWPLGDFTFTLAAQGGNLDILQWLHDEGCPWPEHLRVHENLLKPETREWLIANGYRSRIIRSD